MGMPPAIPVDWQLNEVMNTEIGCIVGAAITDFRAEQFGRQLEGMVPARQGKVPNKIEEYVRNRVKDSEEKMESIIKDTDDKGHILLEAIGNISAEFQTQGDDAHRRINALIDQMNNRHAALTQELEAVFADKETKFEKLKNCLVINLNEIDANKNNWESVAMQAVTTSGIILCKGMTT